MADFLFTFTSFRECKGIVFCVMKPHWRPCDQSSPECKLVSNHTKLIRALRSTVSNTSPPNPSPFQIQMQSDRTICQMGRFSLQPILKHKTMGGNETSAFRVFRVNPQCFSHAMQCIPHNFISKRWHLPEPLINSLQVTDARLTAAIFS